MKCLYFFLRSLPIMLARELQLTASDGIPPFHDGLNFNFSSFYSFLSFSFLSLSFSSRRSSSTTNTRSERRPDLNLRRKPFFRESHFAIPGTTIRKQFKVKFFIKIEKNFICYFRNHYLTILVVLNIGLTTLS